MGEHELAVSLNSCFNNFHCVTCREDVEWASEACHWHSDPITGICQSNMSARRRRNRICICEVSHSFLTRWAIPILCHEMFKTVCNGLAHLYFHCSVVKVLKYWLARICWCLSSQMHTRLFCGQSGWPSWCSSHGVKSTEDIGEHYWLSVGKLFCTSWIVSSPATDYIQIGSSDVQRLQHIHSSLSSLLNRGTYPLPDSTFVCRSTAHRTIYQDRLFRMCFLVFSTVWNSL